MGALMNRSSSLVLLLLLVIILLVDSATAFSLYPKKHVHVANNLTSSISLDVHCKSGDDDLGDQAVAYNQEFSWSFRDSIFGNTRFECEVGWTDLNGQKYGQNFESYKAVDTSCHPDFGYPVLDRGFRKQLGPKTHQVLSVDGLHHSA
ncbi:hypothetical protein Scep_007879 [Stephania cephalantha]|uniref:S-protein homolog n=1 Tax=Stephania cephalantha TaxID=152367 RepID=A0AAP0PM69_9MAGN